MLLSFNLNAAELNLGFYSFHLFSSGLNESNYLIGISTKHAEFGTYQNSYDVRSYYVARKFSYNDKISFMGGVVSGYSSECIFASNKSSPVRIDKNKTPPTLTGVSAPELPPEINTCNESDLSPLIAMDITLTDNVHVIVMGDAFMLVLKLPIK
jgi:hypothetical protein